MTISLLVLVPARKTSAERRASSTRTGFSPANTTHFTSSSGWSLGQVQNRTASPDFNVVTVGAEAKQTLHASEIQNRKHCRPRDLLRRKRTRSLP